MGEHRVSLGGDVATILGVIEWEGATYVVFAYARTRPQVLRRDYFEHRHPTPC